MLRRQVEQTRHEPINQVWFATLVQLISAGMVLVHPGNAEVAGALGSTCGQPGLA